MKRKTIERGIIKDFNFVCIQDVQLSDNPKGELGMDSLDMIDVMMRLEKRFCINIKEEEFKKVFCNTINDVVDFIESKLLEDGKETKE